MGETDSGQVCFKNLQEVQRRKAKEGEKKPQNLVTGERFSESDW